MLVVRRFPHLAVLLSLAACGSSAPPRDVSPPIPSTAPSPAPIASGSQGAAASADLASTAPPPTDVRLRSLAMGALTCPWDAKNGFGQQGCAGFIAWDDEKESFQVGAADVMLVGMLERETEGERYLAASKLARFGEKMSEDPALASRVVAVAERETSEAVGNELGRVVARIRLSKTRLADRVFAIGRKHPNVALRASVLEIVAFANPDLRPQALEVFAETVKDPDTRIRKTTVLGLWHSTTDPKACALLASAWKDTDARVGIDAMRSVTYAACAKSHDALLAELETRIASKKADSYEYGIMLANVCRSGTDARKKQGAKLARTIVDGKGSGSTRESALTSMTICDADWKTSVARYTKDANESVAKRAQELLDKGPPDLW